MKEYSLLYGLNARRFALGSDGSDQVFLAAVTADTTGSQLRVIALPARLGPKASSDEDTLVTATTAILDVCLAPDEAGRLTAVWNQLDPDGAKLWFARRMAPGQWTRPSPISPQFGSALSPALARDDTGRIWCAFTSNSLGRHQVFITWFRGGQWALPQRISDGDGWCFAPAVCRFGEAVRIVWDAKIDGVYGIYMRELDTHTRQARREPQAIVAQANTLLANPACLALDAENSLVVYEQAQAAWGRRNRVERRSRIEMLAGNYLQARRDLHGVIIGPAGCAPLAGDINHTVDAAYPLSVRTRPQLGRDNQGGLWLAYQQLDSIDADRAQSGFVQAITRYQNGRWLPPKILPDGSGINCPPAALAAAPDGALLAAYAQRRPTHYRAHVVRIAPAGDSGWPKTKIFSPMPIAEFTDAAPTARVSINGWHDSPQLLWGDLHRHSNLSPCRWWIEGTPQDAYRYAIAAAELDFFALTDHYQVLRTPDARCDVHHLANAHNLPGFFTAFCAAEVSLPDSDGHMVILSQANALSVPKTKPSRRALLDQLRPADTVVIPHHTADPDAAYCWTGHDDVLAPAAELYQPYRGSFEAPEAPSPPTTWAKQGHTLLSESTLLAAWKAGLKLGVVAGSDHLSTGAAFTGVWAKANTRADILAALRARRCFAASDRIELAFWADDHFMGESFRVSPPLPSPFQQGDAAGRNKTKKSHPAPAVNFRIRCRAAAPLAKIELLRDGDVVHVFKPAAGRKVTRITAGHKLTLTPGEHFYTLRLYQRDKNMAWSSPIWISA
ncbi:MAG: DUF3604 domain-containing protein [Planctomycetes bacterium]|nr:DUF3604 domain-containing protein [Planctomycetota bacterium]